MRHTIATISLRKEREKRREVFLCLVSLVRQYDKLVTYGYQESLVWVVSYPTDRFALGFAEIRRAYDWHTIGRYHTCWLCLDKIEHIIYRT